MPKIRNFSQLSPGLTQLWHIKRDHPVFFFLSLVIPQDRFLQRYDRFPRSVAR